MEYQRVEFPTLVRLTRNYLAIPGSSIPSERAFSAAGLTWTQLRASLEAGTDDKLLVAKKLFERRMTVETGSVSDDSPKRNVATVIPAAENAPTIMAEPIQYRPHALTAPIEPTI